mgnify:CR=1 FL=1
MAVYTSVEREDLVNYLKQYDLSDLLDYKGISSGVTNSNYLVVTKDDSYILTIFEHAHQNELNFYVDLMAHLSHEGIACPCPVAMIDQKLIGELNKKPSLLVSFINGQEIQDVDNNACFEIGAALAKIHMASKTFLDYQKNPRSLMWMKKTFSNIIKHLTEDEKNLIKNELIFLEENSLEGLPSGIIHADLFRDNVLFKDNQIAGIIDFYYACHDIFILDIAITANDWCCHQNSFDHEKFLALIDGYESIRELEPSEREHLNFALRFAAMRFFLSRLFDFYNAKEGELTNIKPPEVFKQLLIYHQASQ